LFVRDHDFQALERFRRRQFCRTLIGAAFALAFAVELTGCGGPILTTRLAFPSPSPTAAATASPAPAPLAVSPESLAFGATSNVQTVAVSGGVSGAYTVVGCAGIAIASIAGAVVTVTAVAGGTCTLTVSDGAGDAVGVAVAVTTVSVPVQ
jgi:hypothetical protein